MAHRHAARRPAHRGPRAGRASLPDRHVSRRVRLCELRGRIDDGAPEKALESAWRLVEIDPSCAQALTLAAQTALRSGDLARAREWFSRARVVGSFERPFALSMLAGLERHP